MKFWIESSLHFYSVFMKHPTGNTYFLDVAGDTMKKARKTLYYYKHHWKGSY